LWPSAGSKSRLATPSAKLFGLTLNNFTLDRRTREISSTYELLGSNPRRPTQPQLEEGTKKRPL